MITTEQLLDCRNRTIAYYEKENAELIAEVARLNKVAHDLSERVDELNERLRATRDEIDYMEQRRYEF